MDQLPVLRENEDRSVLTAADRRLFRKDSPGRLGAGSRSVLALFAAYNAAATGPAVWTRAFWNDYAARWAEDYAFCYVAEANGLICAYLRNGYGSAIVEIAAEEGADEAVRALLLHACREAQKAGNMEIDAPGELACGEALQAMRLRLGRENVSGQLYRIVHLATNVSALLPRIQARWKHAPLADWKGAIHLDSDVGSVCLSIRDSYVSVSDSPEAAMPEARLPLTHAQAIDLLFGQVPQTPYRFHNTAYEETLLRILEILFPLHPYRWYPKDVF